MWRRTGGSYKLLGYVAVLVHERQRYQSRMILLSDPFFPPVLLPFSVSPCDAVAVAIGNSDPTPKMYRDELIQRETLVICLLYNCYTRFSLSLPPPSPMLGRIWWGIEEREKTSFQLQTEGQVDAAGGAVVGPIGLCHPEGGNVKMTFFFSFFLSFFFWQGKGSQFALRHSLTRARPSQIHALGIIHFAVHGTAASGRGRRRTLKESQQLDDTFSINLAPMCVAKTSDAFCISFPNTPLPTLYNGACCWDMIWRRGNRYMYRDRHHPPPALPPHIFGAQQLREDIRFNSIWRASITKINYGIFRQREFFWRLRQLWDF